MGLHSSCGGVYDICFIKIKLLIINIDLSALIQCEQNALGEL